LRSPAIARNYAEALFELSESSGRAEEYAGLLEAVAAAIASSPEIEAVLMSPRVPKARKVDLVGQALRAAPPEFVRFIQAVVRRGRQQYFADIAREYGALVDTKFNRLRAAVSLAREPNEALRESIRAGLSQAFGKEVYPTFFVDPTLLGGTIVKVGDRIFDGSIRRRMASLRRQLLTR
jgi:F-type H+-transporting ATPase subunit delta